MRTATSPAAASPRRVNRTGKVVLAFVVAALLCAVHVFNLVGPESRVLDLGVEGSITTLLAAAGFVVAGLLAGWNAYLDQRHRLGWSVLAVVGIVFGLEEGGLMLHERFEEASSTGLGLIVAIVAGLACLALAIRYGSARLPAPAPLFVVGAGSALVISQVLGAGATRLQSSGLGQQVLAVGEECGELLIAALLAAAAGYVLARRGHPPMPTAR